MENYTCPCCEYKTLDNEHENDICPICYWEDDYYQFKNVELEDAVNNGVSLRQAQQSFIESGSCERRMLECVRKPNLYDVKDVSWKPLDEEK